MTLICAFLASPILVLFLIHYVSLFFDIQQRKQATRVEVDPSAILKAELNAIRDMQATQPMILEA